MTEEKKAETPVPEAEPVSVPVAAEPKKKGSALKIIGIVVGVVVVLIGAILGYGFWNGGQIRKYATDSEKLYTVTADWGNAFDETDMAKVKSKVTEIGTESEKALVTLNAKAAPSKAKQLKADLVEYFTLSKKVATDAEGIVDWAIEIQKVTTDISSMSSLNTSTPEAMITSVDKAKTDIDASIVKLEKMTVPESLKIQHDAFVKMMKDMSIMYGKLSVALKANDLNALTTISNDFSTSASALDNVEDPEKSIGDALKVDSDRIDKLDISINNAIASLKNTGFSF